jgi:hypothetical protein
MDPAAGRSSIESPQTFAVFWIGPGMKPFREICTKCTSAIGPEQAYWFCRVTGERITDNAVRWKNILEFIISESVDRRCPYLFEHSVANGMSDPAGEIPNG